MAILVAKMERRAVSLAVATPWTSIPMRLFALVCVFVLAATSVVMMVQPTAAQDVGARIASIRSSQASAQRSLRALDSAIEDDPTLYQAHSSRGYVLRKTGDYYESLASYNRALEINPRYAEGQVTGGAVQGIGQALYEEIIHRNGAVANPNLTDYKIPTMADVPDVEVVLVEQPSASGPFGAKGVGEPALIPTAPAILNAITDALGPRITQLPVNLERILETCIKAGHFGPKEVENG